LNGEGGPGSRLDYAKASGNKPFDLFLHAFFGVSSYDLFRLIDDRLGDAFHLI